MQFDLFNGPHAGTPDTAYNGFTMLNENQKSTTQGIIQRAIDNSGLSGFSVIRAKNGFKVLHDGAFEIVDMFYYNSVNIRIISAKHCIPWITLWVYDTTHQQKLYNIMTDNLNEIRKLKNEM